MTKPNREERRQWAWHVAVYGPPAAGKSALVEAAARAGYPALDLEQFGGSFEERRARLDKWGTNAPSSLLGAADIPPEAFPANTKFVLLAPSPEELVRRVRRRGDRRDHKWIDKALQVRSEHLEMASEGVFDLVITDEGSPDQVLERLVRGFAAL